MEVLYRARHWRESLLAVFSSVAMFAVAARGEYDSGESVGWVGAIMIGAVAAGLLVHGCLQLQSCTLILDRRNGRLILQTICFVTARTRWVRQSSVSAVQLCTTYVRNTGVIERSLRLVVDDGDDLWVAGRPVDSDAQGIARALRVPLRRERHERRVPVEDWS